jgi:hypothetical protein
MVFNQKLNDFQYKMYNIIIIASYILIIASFLGLSTQAPIYLQTIEYYVRIYVCLFLIWRFNPLRNAKTFTDLDRKIAFSAGIFVLTTTILYQYLQNIRDFVNNMVVI